MQLIKSNNPISNFWRIEKDIDNFWNNGWGVFPQLNGASNMLSALDMYEEGGMLVAEVSLPNYKKEEIKLSADNGVLEISAAHKETKEKDEDRRYYFKENSSRYMRRVMLPDGVSVDKVDASFKDGMLKIVMPIESQNESKSITIK